MASKSAPSEAKAKKPRRKAKPKKFESLIDYGDPNTKVVVRLLPPTLEMKDFIKQAEDHSSTFKSGYKSLTYRKGSNAAQAFEEPGFSLAFVKFHSPEAAESFRSEITGVSFSETSSGDNIKCSTIKPIFGEISAAAPVGESAINSAVFSIFANLREKNEGHADINTAIDAVKSRLKQKAKPKSEKKKFEKAKTRNPKDVKSLKEGSKRHSTDKDERSRVSSAPDDKSTDGSSNKNKPSKLSHAEKKKNKNKSSSKKAKQKKVEEQKATKTPGTTSKAKAPKKKQRAENNTAIATSTPSV